MVGVAHCTVSGGAVTVRYEDSSTVYIPADIVSRSTVLEQALQSARGEREFKLPQEVRLQSWADTASSLVHGPAELRMFYSRTIGEALTVSCLCPLVQDNTLLVLLKGAAHDKYMDRVSAPGACRQQTFSWTKAPYMRQLMSWVVASALTMQLQLSVLRCCSVVPSLSQHTIPIQQRRVHNLLQKVLPLSCALMRRTFSRLHCGYHTHICACRRAVHTH